MAPSLPMDRPGVVRHTLSRDRHSDLKTEGWHQGKVKSGVEFRAALMEGVLNPSNV